MTISVEEVQEQKKTEADQVEMSAIKVKSNNELLMDDAEPEASSKKKSKKGSSRKNKKTQFIVKKQKRKHVLENKKNLKRPREFIKRVLPQWLNCPVFVGNDLKADGCPISDFDFLSKTIPALQSEGISYFFPVQKLLIPSILLDSTDAFSWTRRKDLCVSAATGSGKTLAYVLPILYSIACLNEQPCIRAVVVLPTQQLAEQVLKVFRVYSQYFNLKVGSAIGFRSTVEEQKELIHVYEEDLVTGDGDMESKITLSSNVHIVVATPGKLETYMENTAGFDLSNLLYLVFDEADILLSNDGGEWLREIEKKIRVLQDDTNRTNAFNNLAWPKKHCVYAQRILVSATLSSDPELLNAMDLYKPILFCTQGSSASSVKDVVVEETESEPEEEDPVSSDDASTPTPASSTKKDTREAPSAPFIRPPGLSEEIVMIDASVKPLGLHHLILSRKWKKTLVFVNSSVDGHDLAMLLEILSAGAYKVAEFSAKLGRTQSMVTQRFRKGDINVLVSTDLLDRGMDLNVNTVVNYHLPKSKDTYVHRIGRTARAGAEGLAISLCNLDHKIDKSFRSWTKKTKPTTLEMKELVQYEEVYGPALKELKKKQAEQKKWKRTNWQQHGVGVKRKPNTPLSVEAKKSKPDGVEENPGTGS